MQVSAATHSRVTSSEGGGDTVTSFSTFGGRDASCIGASGCSIGCVLRRRASILGDSLAATASTGRVASPREPVTVSCDTLDVTGSLAEEIALDAASRSVMSVAVSGVVKGPKTNLLLLEPARTAAPHNA